MEIIQRYGWVYYVGDNNQFDSNKVGKWMYFFKDKKFVAEICEDAVKKNIINQSKHSDEETGVACFYLNCDDIETHKKILSYFIENNLIQRTKSGRLYNISFKLNTQTSAGEYGDEFKSEIKLSKFIDLDTGKWML
ncbi:hypothetical protein GKZ28_11900 [Clostridium chromiireducens]|uniref:Uncharacterized protein n=1 Tax=Clostridium chromiireducens TaxID=225345 RepID=A0A964RM65_9CLOT|nr:hypothetical protein [Clostridium chromiireducens]MVX64394.1 hypothetical protein [Clostridium chromiireducens]